MRTNSKSWPVALLLCGMGVSVVAGNRNVVSGTEASALRLIKGSETIARRMGVICNIKGNINAEGERIYHMPGQRHYDDAAVSRLFGERYFCSETEARRAGWRRSSV
jgi:hypothetical protein